MGLDMLHASTAICFNRFLLSSFYVFLPGESTRRPTCDFFAPLYKSQSVLHTMRAYACYQRHQHNAQLVEKNPYCIWISGMPPFSYIKTISTPLMRRWTPLIRNVSCPRRSGQHNCEKDLWQSNLHIEKYFTCTSWKRSSSRSLTGPSVKGCDHSEVRLWAHSYTAWYMHLRLCAQFITEEILFSKCIDLCYSSKIWQERREHLSGKPAFMRPETCLDNHEHANNESLFGDANQIWFPAGTATGCAE